VRCEIAAKAELRPTTRSTSRSPAVHLGPATPSTTALPSLQGDHGWRARSRSTPRRPRRSRPRGRAGSDHRTGPDLGPLDKNRALPQEAPARSSRTRTPTRQSRRSSPGSLKRKAALAERDSSPTFLHYEGAFQQETRSARSPRPRSGRRRIGPGSARPSSSARAVSDDLAKLASAVYGPRSKVPYPCERPRGPRASPWVDVISKLHPGHGYSYAALRRRAARIRDRRRAWPPPTAAA